jgi:hypothetical protein
MPTETPGIAPPLPAAVPVLAEGVPSTTPGSGRSDSELHKQLRSSIVISAARCVFTYVVVPVLGPLFERTLGHDLRLAIALSLTALIFDDRVVRNVWRSDLRWRWRILTGYALIMAGLTALLVSDIWRLAQ